MKKGRCGARKQMWRAHQQLLSVVMSREADHQLNFLLVVVGWNQLTVAGFHVLLQGSCLEWVRWWKVPLPSYPLTSRLRGGLGQLHRGVCMFLCLWVGPAPGDLRFGKFCLSLIPPWHKVCSWVLAPKNHISSGNLPAPFLSGITGPEVAGWACRGNCPPGGQASLLCTSLFLCTPLSHSPPYRHLIPLCHPLHLLLDKAAERSVLVQEVAYGLNQLHFRVN